MAQSLREKGFAATTVADVVRHAGVSRRTFYEHFTDLVDCYLAVADGAVSAVISAIAGAVSVDVPLEQRLREGLDAWLALLAQEPGLSRAIGQELHLAGERGVALLRDSDARTAAMLHDLVEEHRRVEPELRPLPVGTAVLVAAGIREQVMRALGEPDPAPRLREVREAAVDLIHSVLTAPAR